MNIAILVKVSGEMKAVKQLGYFNMDSLKKEFTITEDIDTADILICWKEVPNNVNYKKVILFESEPPIASNIKNMYDSFDLFKAVFCFNPIKDNQTYITRDPIAYPYSPGKKFQITRENTSLTGKGFFFAGMRRDIPNWKLVNEYNCQIIYQLRTEIALKLKDLNNNSVILGKGFDNNTKDGKWRENKYHDIEKAESDFMFCCDNTILNNYISEKIHDGFNSDRVVCYLGEPNIESFVPENSFINLKKFLNEDEFDIIMFKKFIDSITQEKYDSYLRNARLFRENLQERHNKERNRITLNLIDIIKLSKIK